MNNYKDFFVDITHKSLLSYVNNMACTNYYYLVNGRIYNKNYIKGLKDSKKYKLFKFVLFFDAFDVQEYFEKDYYTKENLEEYLNILIDNNLDLIKNFNDISDFDKMCKQTIEDYKKIKK